MMNESQLDTVSIGIGNIAPEKKWVCTKHGVVGDLLCMNL